jgi:hypothetical protein
LKGTCGAKCKVCDENKSCLLCLGGYLRSQEGCFKPKYCDAKSTSKFELTQETSTLSYETHKSDNDSVTVELKTDHFIEEVILEYSDTIQIEGGRCFQNGLFTHCSPDLKQTKLNLIFKENPEKSVTLYTSDNCIDIEFTVL